MQVQDIMTRDPACCTPKSTLQDVAQQMAECDCGEIPVLDERQRPVGVVTDRDICIRAVAKGKDMKKATAAEIMSVPVYTVQPQDELEQCLRQMEDRQVRRVPVVDAHGACCGIVAQADIARALGNARAGKVVRDISQGTGPVH